MTRKKLGRDGVHKEWLANLPERHRLTDLQDDLTNSYWRSRRIHHFGREGDDGYLSGEAKKKGWLDENGSLTREGALEILRRQDEEREKALKDANKKKQKKGAETKQPSRGDVIRRLLESFGIKKARVRRNRKKDNGYTISIPDMDVNFTIGSNVPDDRLEEEIQRHLPQ